MSFRNLAEFFSGPFLVQFEIIFIAVVFVAALFFYSNRKSSADGYKSRFKLLVVITLVFRIFYPLIETIGQYFVWRVDSFSQLLLPPHQSLGYFFSYAWLHFWFNAVLAIGLALVFYLLFRSFKKYNPRFFEEGEVELGFLCALLVGWPQFVVFAALIFVLVVIFSILRRIFLKEMYAALGAPFLTAAAIALLWGYDLVLWLGLGVLRI